MSYLTEQRPIHVAGAVTVIGITLARSIHYISSLFMMAYLSPEVIGEFAFAMFLMLSIYTLLTTGVESRIIAMESGKNYLAESWTIELLRGGLTFLVILLVYIYAFYNHSLSPAYEYLTVLGVGMFIRCGKNIKMVTSRKELDMLPIFYVELGSAICLLIVSVVLVILYQSGWALALGYLSGSVAYTFLSFRFLPHEGSVLKFSTSRFREIFSYTKWLMFSAQIVSFFENIIPLMISHIFGLAALGFFEKSDLYTRKIIAQLTQVFWIVGLPWASRNSRDNRQVTEILSLILLFFVVLAIPSLVALSIIVPKLLVSVGGEAWSGSEYIVRALCVVSAIACFNVPFGIVVQAIKRPSLSLWAGVVKLIVFLLILIAWGHDDMLRLIYALAWANLFTLGYYFIASAMSLKLDVRAVLKDSILLSLPFLLFHLVGYESIFDSDIVDQFVFMIVFFIVNLVFCFSVISRKQEVRETILNISKQMLRYSRSRKD